ncbi:MAG: hypothetical protein IJT03_08480 [Clostridia bacterium]|nr:hypothetical protein [Clostridia bacterium]
MTYNKPEMDIEKFDIIEEITADGVSAGGNSDNPGGDSGSGSGTGTGGNPTGDSIGSDLIIG